MALANRRYYTTTLMVFYSTVGTENGGFDFSTQLGDRNCLCYETIGSEHCQILFSYNSN